MLIADQEVTLEEDVSRIGFLLDCLIDKAGIMVEPNDPIAFALAYRIDPQSLQKIMDAVEKISADVDSGKQLSWEDAINRVIHASPSSPLSSYNGRPPEIYGADAIRAWAPETWDRIENQNNRL
jgi:hypothetical protein